MRYSLSAFLAAVAFLALFLGVVNRLGLGRAVYIVPLLIAAFISGLGYKLGRILLLPVLGIVLGGFVGGVMYASIGLLVGIVFSGLMWRELTQ
jgi:hypothetical protein